MKSKIRFEGCEMLVSFSDCTPAELDALVGRLLRVLGFVMGSDLRPTTSSMGFQYIAESQSDQVPSSEGCPKGGVGSDSVARGVARSGSTKRNPPPATRTPPERGPGATAKRSRHKVCVICGKEFTDKSPTNTRKVCGALCARKRDAARHPRKPAAPARAPDGNPADPLLTDAQRAELQAKRFAAIKAAAQKYKD